MIEVRVRTRISDEELNEKLGKVVTDDDYNVLITRDARVLTPDGRLLCVFRKRAINEAMTEKHYPVFHSLRDQRTDNRGLASGTERVKRGDQKRTRSAQVASAIIGSFDPSTPRPYCRLTAWTGVETEQFESLYPFFRAMSDVFGQSVPERHEVQWKRARQTDQAWVIPGTPYTTITVNNTYPTGVHTDKGDLDEGFSCLSCIRRGSYTGGVLVFPRYRVAVDMHDGDMVMMDAHEWHGNTHISPRCIACQPGGGGGCKHDDPPAERISVVAYYRTDMLACGTAEQEQRKAQRAADIKSGLIGNLELPL